MNKNIPKALRLPKNFRNLVTKKPDEGDESEYEVRFAVFTQRESRSKESRRRWALGIAKKRERVWQVVAHGMIQKIGADKYQFRGAIYGPRGRRMFEAVLSGAELRSLFNLGGNTPYVHIPGVATRNGKHVMTYDPRFYFQTRKFLTDEVKKLIEEGKITRPKKW